jgi:hypothetical protein
MMEAVKRANSNNADGRSDRCLTSRMSVVPHAKLRRPESQYQQHNKVDPSARSNGHSQPHDTL